VSTPGTADPPDLAPQFAVWVRTSRIWERIGTAESDSAGTWLGVSYLRGRHISGDVAVLVPARHPSDPLGAPLRPVQDERGLFETMAGPPAGSDVS
jgi:hypothetical protein